MNDSSDDDCVENGDQTMPKNHDLLLKQIRKHDWMAQTYVGDTVTSTVNSVG